MGALATAYSVPRLALVTTPPPPAGLIALLGGVGPIALGCLLGIVTGGRVGTCAHRLTCDKMPAPQSTGASRTFACKLKPFISFSHYLFKYCVCPILFLLNH